MITEIMDYCNNHFIISSESPTLTFKDTLSVYTIEADFSDTYLVGQYIYVDNSILNNCAFKITAVETGKLTVDTVVLDEESEDARIYGCAVPKGFLTLVTNITTWVSTNGGNDGIASEKIDDYSISYGSGTSGSNGSTWVGAFSGRLGQYRSVFNDVSRCDRGYY